MVGVIDYGMGNLLSVTSAIEMVGQTVKICHAPEEITGVDLLVLPGVGAIEHCMRQLREKAWIEKLNQAVLVQKKPILGICLGMQAMAKTSDEGGNHPCLGWFDSEVVRLQPSDSQLRVPQIGWNPTTYEKGSPYFRGLPAEPEFYFVHSYAMKCKNESEVVAWCDHGGRVTAAVAKENIFATQFHPEKSQDYGLKVLENFFKHFA